MFTKWDKAHVETAEVYAKLSSAKRLKVGCVIVKGNRIISIGYNGMPSGWDNECEELVKWPNGDVRFMQTKAEVLHAETNAIAKLAKSSESGDNSTMYCTHAPCIDCAKLIYQAGVSRVIYKYDYRNLDGVEFLKKCGVSTVKYEDKQRLYTDADYCDCGKLHEECPDNYEHMSRGY